MAILKIINRAKKYHDDTCYEDLVHYCTASRKCPDYCITGRAINPRNAAVEMRCVAEAYGKTSGIRLRHMVLSFSPRELSASCDADVDAANKIAWDMMGFYCDRYQIIACVHTSKQHLHIHFLMNTVSYLDGRKYKGDKRDYYRFQAYIKEVLDPFGITKLKTV